MKSFLIWMLVTLIGAALGYGIGWLTGMNLYLCIGIGIIFGSSVGVTINIHRDRETTKVESEVKSKEIDSDIRSFEPEIKEQAKKASQKGA